MVPVRCGHILEVQLQGEVEDWPSVVIEQGPSSHVTDVPRGIMHVLHSYIHYVDFTKEPL